MKSRHKKPYVRIILFITKILAIVSAVFVILAAAASFFAIKNITVEPGGHYTEEEIINLYINGRIENITYLLYLKDKLLGQKQVPFIQQVDITVIDRNSVHLQVYDKKVTGCVSFMGSYMYFDIEGRVVESSDKHFEEIPVITGLIFDRIILNEVLKVQKSNLFNVILNITSTIQKYNMRVERVDFMKNDEVVLYCDGHVIEIGKHDFYDEQIALASSIVEKLGDEKYKINIKDITSGQDKYIAVPIK